MHLYLTLLMERCPNGRDIWVNRMPVYFMPSRKKVCRHKRRLIREYRWIKIPSIQYMLWRIRGRRHQVRDRQALLALVRIRWVAMEGHLHDMLFVKAHKYILYNHIHTDWVVRFFVLLLQNQTYRVYASGLLKYNTFSELTERFRTEYMSAQSEYPHSESNRVQ